MPMAAVPTPEPKKLSDEELKKYGIHMATRLQSEDTKGGQSNWADIDDDDDDWAPEAITWTDGTKITLPPADESHDQVTDPTPAASSSAKEQLSNEKSRSQGPSRTASPSAKSTNLASGKGLILKSGSADKTSLVAKPPAPPGPSRSPWATLPPVQKTPPVLMEPPGQYAGTRPMSRDHVGARPAGFSVPREISADDFSRSTWRDAPAPFNRDVYNPQAGRYDAIGDRRGSFRGDIPTRPSLLQRPQPSHHEPAEPSPPFQSSRAMQDGPYGRRRGSSNVSGGSGYLQRVSKAYEPGSMAPPDALGVRRSSLAASTDSQVSPQNLATASQQTGRLQSSHPWPPRASPTVTHATPHYSHASPESNQAPQMAASHGVEFQSEEETVEYQKRLMREKREAAIKRRLEEEAREEAAKAERIRMKLEAMGPPPERKSAKKETSSNQDASSPATASAEPVAAVTSPTPGNAEPQSASHQAAQVSPSAASSAPKSTEPESDATTPLGTSSISKPSQQNLWDGTAQASGRFTSWPASTQLSRNVWGSPNNDHGLGNGTFNPDLGRVPESQAAPLPQPQLKGPAPIAPPSSARLLSRNQPSGQPYPAPREDGYTPAEPRPHSEKQSQWVSAVLQTDNALRDQRVKERQDLDQRLAEQGLNFEQAQATIKHTWRQESSITRMGHGNHVTAPAWEKDHEDRSKQAMSATHDGLTANGIIGPGSSPLLASGTSTTSSQSRPSRFFPSKDKDSRSGAHAHAGAERIQSPSPPPPTMDDHPVYDGDASHPNVSLPRPQPVVKLPPSRSGAHSLVRGQKGEPTWSAAGASSAQYNPHSVMGGLQGAQHSAAAAHGAPQSQQEWQEKIYELTGRRAAPKSPVVESASSRTLDHVVIQQQPATVSLPNYRVVREFDGATTKPMAEECFEEQEMGSLPQVRIPHHTPAASFSPASFRAKPFPRGFAVLAATAKSFDILDHPGGSIRISLPCMRVPKNVPYHRNTGRTNSRGSGHGRSGGRHRGPGTAYRGGNGGKRDASSHSIEANAAQPSASTSAPRGRGYRGRSGDTWPRRSGQPTTN